MAAGRKVLKYEILEAQCVLLLLAWETFDPLYKAAYQFFANRRISHYYGLDRQISFLFLYISVLYFFPLQFHFSVQYFLIRTAHMSRYS